jgi:saccharopine dehydrogenase-like NADP-dependent oxidoreductase
LSAIQTTPAAAICAVLDLLATGELNQTGYIRQEDIPLKTFLENRFGRAYARPAMRLTHQHFGGEGDDERFLDQVRIGS